MFMLTWSEQSTLCHYSSLDDLVDLFAKAIDRHRGSDHSTSHPR
jgi:hypothetical protein